MEEQLQKILNDPEAMEKLMQVAQNLGGAQSPDLDPGMLQKLSGIAGQGNIDPQQKALLNALMPYLSRRRIHKLENAMRAARMARFAAGALGMPKGG